MLCFRYAVPTLPIFRIEATLSRNTRWEGMIHGKVDGSDFTKVLVMIAR